MNELAFSSTMRAKNVETAFVDYLPTIYLQLSNVRVHSVFNEFIMLANTQFVENVSTSFFRLEI